MEKDYNFQKLTPIKNVDLKIYKNALDFVFKNDDLKNIGMSGPYSAGKSSVIETYKLTRPDLNFIHISLACFSPAEEKPSNKDSEKEFESILEGKILNQLIHQINSNNITQTNFKIKQQIEPRNIRKTSLLIVIFIISSIFMHYFDRWCNYVYSLDIEMFKNILLWSTNNVWRLVCVFICLVLGGLAIHTIVKVQKNHNIFRKLKLQGNEIEIFSQSDDSFFDKYLNEVLYLFENSKADVIVFEDMDRYNVNTIFQRLKEINTLINNKRQKKSLAPIRFFYLLKDDIFISKDRTKFFDFMIPIVPIIDSSNSYDQFIKHFKAGGIYELFDSHFLQDISLYVDDMRILKNIYNEFVIYHNQIQSIELNNNKLLAMVLYKNIFPRDFSDLQLNRGFVHTLFEKKMHFISQSIEAMEKEIIHLENILKKANEDWLQNIDELDAMYFTPNQYAVRVNNKDVESFNSLTDFMRALKSNPQNATYYNSYQGRAFSYDFMSALNGLRTKPEYIERKAWIDAKLEEKNEEIKNQISNIRERIEGLKNSKLKDLINRNNVSEIFSITYTNEINEETEFLEIKSNPYFDLIKYLVRHGYIDETYQDYMTYFYESSLSRTDKIFLRSITDESAKEYGYILKDPKMILSRLSIINFDNEEVLNFDLLNYLLCNNNLPKVISCLDHLFKQIKDSEKYDFIEAFWKAQQNQALFVKELNYQWPQAFASFLMKAHYTHVWLNEYALSSIYYSSDNELQLMNDGDQALSFFISHSDDFLDITEPNIERIIHVFKLLKVKFVKINYEASNSELFEQVYNENLYEFDFRLICMMLISVYGYQQSESFYHENLSLVLTKKTEPLKKYIEENINQYVTMIIENSSGVITDNIEAISFIMNCEDVTNQNKESYLRLVQTKIPTLQIIEDIQWWPLILENAKITVTVENVLAYFANSGNGLDVILVEFINKSDCELDFVSDNVSIEDSKERAIEFAREIIGSKKISLARYQTILSQFSFHYENFTITDMDDSKLRVLIDLGYLTMNQDNLLLFRESYPHLLYYYICKNISEYVNIMIPELFIQSELLSVLEMNIDDAYKIQLLKFSTECISILNIECSDNVKVYILQNHFDVKDIETLFQHYETYGDTIMPAILSVAIRYTNLIYEDDYKISLKLYEQLMASSQISDSVKIELFISVLPYLNESQCKNSLQILKMKNMLKVFEQKSTKLEANEINECILQKFNEHGWIIRFQSCNEGKSFKVIRRYSDSENQLPTHLL